MSCVLALVVHCTIGVLLYRGLCVYDCIGCVSVCVKNVCLSCVYVCVHVFVYVFACVCECTTVHIRRRHAARYGRL